MEQKERILKMYEMMYLIRKYEERVNPFFCREYYPVPSTSLWDRKPVRWECCLTLNQATMWFQPTGLRVMPWLKEFHCVP